MDRRTIRPPTLTRRRFLLACGGAAAAGIYGLSQWDRPGGLKVAHRASAALGTNVSMTALHADPRIAERGLDAAFAELARVERVMSLYQSDSQLCRLNRDGIVADPDPYLVEILQQCRAASLRSDGAFDQTVQPLWAAYATAKAAGRQPSDAEIDVALRLIDWRAVDISDHQIRLQKAGMAVTLNGIAQGFATDRAMAALKKHGIEHALVNGGEIATRGQKENDQPWRIGIQHPRVRDAYVGVAALDGRCMSTSGDYETAFSDDLKSNHIVDPSTGRSPTALASVTVVAPTATDADVLSTAIFVLGPDRGMALARSTAGTDVLLVLKDGSTLMTNGFPLQSSATSDRKESAHVHD